MPSPLTLTAEEVSRRVELEHRQSYERTIPRVSGLIQRIQDENKLHVFNVGPWDMTRHMGSWGTFRVPACPLGTEYVEGPEIPGIYLEPIIENERRMRHEQIDGKDFADHVMGIGKGYTPRDRWAGFGVFVSKNAAPTKKELADARAALEKKLLELVSEARAAHNKGPKEAEMTISDQHRIAAQMLNLTDEPWFKQYTPEARQKCPNCGTMSEAQVVTCPQCLYVFDPERYKALKGRFASQA